MSDQLTPARKARIVANMKTVLPVELTVKGGRGSASTQAYVKGWNECREAMQRLMAQQIGELH